MKFLVSGAAGFIGSHISEALLKEGHEVVAVDSLHTGNRQNLAFASKGLQFIQANVGDVAKLSMPELQGIFHQGIYSSSPMYKDDPTLTAKAVAEFIALLEFARTRDLPITFASSSSLYNGLQPPQREDMSILVSDYYTEARLAMERLAELYHKLYGLKVIALRYFSVYGPREEFKQQYANLASQFIWALEKNEQPVVYGDGLQSRDFIYVKDVADANLCAFKSKIKFGIFNVGTGKRTSLNELLALLNKKLGKTLVTRHIENQIKNYVAHTQADTKNTEEKLGFKAKVPLEKGIEQLIAYYREKK